MHCIERAWERYAIQLNNLDVRALERQIESGASLIVRRENNETVVHLVRHDGAVMVAVYGRANNKPGMRIITFLPPESVMGGNQMRRQSATERDYRGGRTRHKGLKRSERLSRMSKHQA